ncbi:hypothetical protein Slin15195_G030960 [Septoria linicola]|uniref:Uncharacterized protein n=1 Tax=Septoria linicola TaxID=215465 RepID=A0A9Q9AIB1_9PEZI|nr:hypothetical protein Slin14017_G029980 [Septoria linicola]USW49777.1 hypothetical protein Slin15195_G030960 [Septoria linicola]
MSSAASGLRIGLEAVSNSRVKITLSNSNSDHTLTLLRWDTPLDPRALDTGVLVLTDRDSGKVIPSPGLKLNRKLPPTREDFVEIAPSSKVSEERELKGPWLPSAGQRVSVHVEGEWKALWSKSTAAVKQEALDALDGDGCYRAAFRSDAIELEI